MVRGGLVWCGLVWCGLVRGAPPKMTMASPSMAALCPIRELGGREPSPSTATFTHVSAAGQLASSA